jgi:hypothetical protein
LPPAKSPRSLRPTIRSRTERDLLDPTMPSPRLATPHESIPSDPPPQPRVIRPRRPPTRMGRFLPSISQYFPVFHGSTAILISDGQISHQIPSQVNREIRARKWSVTSASPEKETAVSFIPISHHASGSHITFSSSHLDICIVQSVPRSVSYSCGSDDSFRFRTRDCSRSLPGPDFPVHLLLTFYPRLDLALFPLSHSRPSSRISRSEEYLARLIPRDTHLLKIILC